MLLAGATVVNKLTSEDSCVHLSSRSAALCAMTPTGLQIPYFAICLSPCHRFSLKLNDEPESAANRRMPNYCRSLACRTHQPTEYRQTKKKKKSTITRATNPLIRTWSSFVFKRQDQCQAKVRKQMQGAYREKGWALVLNHKIRSSSGRGQIGE